MLVLSRKAEETIAIGENIVITILRVQGQAVRIGIEAPQEVRVRRGELSPEPKAKPVVKPVAAVLRDARPRDRNVINQTMDRNREVRTKSPAFRPGLLVEKSRSLPRLATAAIA